MLFLRSSCSDGYTVAFTQYAVPSFYTVIILFTSQKNPFYINVYLPHVIPNSMHELCALSHS